MGRWGSAGRRDEGAGVGVGVGAGAARNMRGDKWRLTRVYVSTNGDSAWWEAITSELRGDGWEVRGSADMDFVRDEDGGESSERRKSERVVGLAVDMEVAARAEVFIGNGVRGLTIFFNFFFLIFLVYYGH